MKDQGTTAHSRFNRPVVRLAIVATIVAVIATVIVAYSVIEMSRDAASAEYVVGPTLMFSSACFLLAWPAVFLTGWLYMRLKRAGSGGAA